MKKEIIRTENYSQFKHFKENRSIDPGHVTKLRRLIQKKNLLEDFPIIVDEQMRIIDGQHRLEAAKQLKTHVFYFVAKRIQKADIPQVNSSPKRWKPLDYLHMYCSTGNEEYKKFKKFMDSSELTFIIAYNILKNCSINDSIMFKEGKLKFPEDNSKAEMIVAQLNELSKYFPTIKQQVHLVLAIIDINKNELYSHNRMMQKLKIESLEKGISTVKMQRVDYIAYLNDIYNKHERSDLKMIYFKRVTGNNRVNQKWK